MKTTTFDCIVWDDVVPELGELGDDWVVRATVGGDNYVVAFARSFGAFALPIEQAREFARTWGNPTAFPQLPSAERGALKTKVGNG